MEKVRNLTGKNINYLVRTKEHRTLFRGTEEGADAFIEANSPSAPEIEPDAEPEINAPSIHVSPKKKKKKNAK